MTQLDTGFVKLKDIEELKLKGLAKWQELLEFKRDDGLFKKVAYDRGFKYAFTTSLPDSVVHNWDGDKNFLGRNAYITTAEALEVLKEFASSEMSLAREIGVSEEYLSEALNAYEEKSRFQEAGGVEKSIIGNKIAWIGNGISVKVKNPAFPYDGSQTEWLEVPLDSLSEKYRSELRLQIEAMSEDERLRLVDLGILDLLGIELSENARLEYLENDKLAKDYIHMIRKELPDLRLAAENFTAPLSHSGEIIVYDRKYNIQHLEGWIDRLDTILEDRWVNADSSLVSELNEIKDGLIKAVQHEKKCYEYEEYRPEHGHVETLVKQRLGSLERISGEDEVVVQAADFLRWARSARRVAKLTPAAGRIVDNVIENVKESYDATPKDWRRVLIDSREAA